MVVGAVVGAVQPALLVRRAAIVRRASLNAVASPWQLETDDERGTVVVLRAAQAVRRGEEVLLPYGAETNAELLTTHGFALEENEHDHIPLTLAPRDEHAEMKARILAAGNITECAAPHTRRPLYPCGRADPRLAARS